MPKIFLRNKNLFKLEKLNFELAFMCQNRHGSQPRNIIANKTEYNKATMRIKFKSEIIPYLMYGLLLNVLSLAILGIITYLNPKTYYGNDGYNNGLIVLIIFIPIWLIIIAHYRSKKNEIANYGIGMNMTINVIFYLTLCFTE